MLTSLNQLIGLFQQHGATRIYAKVLAPNDNSKNQIYLGGGFAALNIFPHGEIFIDREEKAGSKQDRPKASVNLFWVDENGKHHAPNANLILYPDYPEVRLSGVLQGCRPSPSHLINARLEGRVMLFGVTDDRQILVHVVEDGNPIGNEVKAGKWEELGVFFELKRVTGTDPKTSLLAELRRIHQQGWINAWKLQTDGSRKPYGARNSGGYTLEGELGIIPNGISEPDFLGWEVKQFGVRNFNTYGPKSPITLMTPEPNGGFYKDKGFDAFMTRYGYSDRSGKANRRNFGGKYVCDGACHHLTDLRIATVGFDAKSGKIADLASGRILLLDSAGEEAASWSFKELMDHWNRKHAQAVYVPSLARQSPKAHSFAKDVMLCEGTDFILFLKSFTSGGLFLDPASKVEGVPPRTTSQRRSQFRIDPRKLANLYHKSEVVDILAP